MRKILPVILTLGLSTSALIAQPTVGLLYHDSLAQEGYTLFAPLYSKQTYLVNICGEKVNEWTSDYIPGAATYLTPDGLLARAGNVQNPTFTMGGVGGAIEFFDWEGNLVRTLEVSNDSMCQHHDFIVMPNGNVLVLAWELKSAEEMLSVGRLPGLLDTNGMWPDMVLEYKLLPNDEEEVVWEWHAWDHLVQDADSTLPNYAQISQHPELIQVNVYNSIVPLKDWMHCNGMAYNAELDHIVLSSLSYNEIWIIDHSTTTQEAAGHTGGNHFRGGDLIYRYGNPAIYGRGSVQDQKFFSQHNIHWIPNDYDFGGQLMVFNNRYSNNPFRSRVEIFEPPMTAQGLYEYPGLDAYGPTSPSWTYMDDELFAGLVSGATMLPNGNVLICEGTSGHFTEVDQDGNLHWEYMNPVNANPISQGDTSTGFLVFRAERYTEDFPGFDGIDLSADGYVELNPIVYDCYFRSDTDTTVGIGSMRAEGLRVVNPISQSMRLIGTRDADELRVFNAMGQLVWQGWTKKENTVIATESWPTGSYVLMVGSDQPLVKRVVKIE